MQLGTPDICDKYTAELQVLPPVFKSFGGKHRTFGKIETIKIKQDNALFWEMVRQDGSGKILVVDAGAEICAVMGDQMATLAVENNWCGIVINGYLRDSAILAEMPIAIWALGSYPMKGPEKNPAQKDVFVTIQNCEIKPQDYLYADEDGLVISSRALPEFNSYF